MCLRFIENGILRVKTDQLLYKLNFANDSCNIETDRSDGYNSSLFSASVSGFIPGLSEQAVKLLTEIASYRLFIIYFEDNINPKIFGNKNSGFIFSFTEYTGNNDSKGYKFNLEGTFINPARTIQPDVLYLSDFIIKL